MDTRSLKTFLQLAGTLHFGRAAEFGNLSPSGLSRIIRRLEDEVGCRLFERNNREVRLTPQGRVFQSQAEELLGRMQELANRLDNSARQLSGTVSLYCSVTACYSLLSRLLPALREQYPGLEVKVQTGDEASALARIAQGREDIAIAARPDQMPEHMSFTELTTTALVFIAPISPGALGDGLSGGPSATSKAYWESAPMIVPEKGLSRERLDNWFVEVGIQPTIYAQVAGNEAIVGMVALGCGIGVVPMLVLQSSPFRESVRVLEVMPELRAFRIGLCCRKQALKNPLVAAMWNHVLDDSRRN